MPVLNIGERLRTPYPRIDLAREVIGVMVHPNDETERLRRCSAMAETLLGMSDQDDEPEAIVLANSWFWGVGGFRTASQSDPYEKQQAAFLKHLSQMLVAGTALHLVWAMDAHHRTQLAGGASISKAISILLEYPAWFSRLSARTHWSAWSHYKLAAHLCAAFTFALHEAFRAPPGEIDERLKVAYDEDLHATLSLAAAYQQFGCGFTPHGTECPLLDEAEIWQLRGIEVDSDFSPEPLPPEMLAVAERHQAKVNNAYR
jgi:hypothetical protein